MLYGKEVSESTGIIAGDSADVRQREVAEALGLEGDRPIHNLLKRERKKNVQGMPKQRGRKPARTLQEYKYENKRLKMENELLRDFLSLVGRK